MEAVLGVIYCYLLIKEVCFHSVIILLMDVRYSMSQLKTVALISIMSYWLVGFLPQGLRFGLHSLWQVTGLITDLTRSPVCCSSVSCS